MVVSAQYEGVAKKSARKGITKEEKRGTTIFTPLQNYAAHLSGITSDSAFGTIANLIGKSPIGSPSTCAQSGPSPFGSQIASVDFQTSMPSKLRSLPSHSAGSAPRYCNRLLAEFVKNSNESSKRSAPVVILNGPP